jgi:hypothetical protein
MDERATVLKTEEKGAGTARHGLSRGHGAGVERSLLGLPAGNEVLYAAANLVNAEEHLVVSVTRVPGHMCRELEDLISEVRAERSRLMRRLFNGAGGELWCAAKHILSASYRVLEAAEKLAGGDASLQAEVQELASGSRRLLDLAMAIADIQKELGDGGYEAPGA